MFLVQGHIGFMEIPFSIMDAIGPLLFSCHLVSNYFNNVLVSSMLLRSVLGLTNQMSTNAQIATGQECYNDYNGLCSFKYTMSCKMIQ